MPSKRALITGASDGIGREFAMQLGRQGWDITALARNEARLKGLVAGLGQGSKYLLADLASPEGLRIASDELKSAHYDLLVNNAGFAVKGAFLENTLEKHLGMLDVNVKAVVALAYAFLEQAKSGDALINLSSGLAFAPMPSIGLYAATKALVTSFSESLWYEQKSRGVYVMGLCPGVTATSFYRNAGSGELKAPALITQTPGQVVARALRALKARRKPTVSSGVMNALLAFSSRLRTRKSVVSQMGSMAI